MKVITNPKLVLITYYGRSGSYFFHSLLDSAKNSISLPPEMYFLWGWLEEKNDIREEDMLYHFHHEFIEYYYYKNRNTHALHLASVEEEGKVFSAYYMDIITDYLSIYNTNKIKARFLAIHHAFALMRNIDFDIDGCHIVYQVHIPSLRLIIELMNCFPNSRHIQMLREPIPTLCSLIKAHAQAEPHRQDFCHLARQIMTGGHDICINGGRSLGIKLESLHKEPEKTMKAATSFLNMEWDDGFLKDTTLGAPWPQKGGFTKGFDHKKTTENNISHQKILSDFDITRLRSLLHSRYLAWGYSTSDDAVLKYETIKPMLEKKFTFEDFSLPTFIELGDDYHNKNAANNTLERRHGMNNFLFHHLARTPLSSSHLLEVI